MQLQISSDSEVFWEVQAHKALNSYSEVIQVQDTRRLKTDWISGKKWSRELKHVRSMRSTFSERSKNILRNSVLSAVVEILKMVWLTKWWHWTLRHSKNCVLYNSLCATSIIYFRRRTDLSKSLTKTIGLQFDNTWCLSHGVFPTFTLFTSQFFTANYWNFCFVNHSVFSHWSGIFRKRCLVQIVN